LQPLAKDEEQWTAKFTVLKESIEHHVEEEEGELFTRARKVLSEENIETLGTRMEKAKTEQLKAAAAKWGLIDPRNLKVARIRFHYRFLAAWQC
jgi:hemerythrin-like domain-containing protein